jgi:hypothetical protein
VLAAEGRKVEAAGAFTEALAGSATSTARCSCPRGRADAPFHLGRRDGALVDLRESTRIVPMGPEWEESRALLVATESEYGSTRDSGGRSE